MKLVALARNGQNILWRPRIILDQSAENIDVLGQIGLFDDLVLPDLADNLVFMQNSSGVFDQK